MQERDRISERRFSDQAAGKVGLQFIALFLIVIAIILFGIAAILEAGELSARRGGLAGYIPGQMMANRGGGDG